MFDLTGKKALVTGSTQGIGYEIAKCLAEYGAKVYVNGATSFEKALSAANTIKGAQPAACDLSKPGCADELYNITGDIDILVCNASVQFRKAWNEITDDEFEMQMNVNFRSTVKLIQKYAPYMIKNNWGRIVTIGSVQQAKPHKDMLIYAASKAAQTNMVINLAKQFAPYGITVNNVAPGVFTTPRNSDALKDEEYKKAVLSNIPCNFMAEPKDCAAIVLLLCSDEGRYITGEDIFADGGMKL